MRVVKVDQLAGLVGQELGVSDWITVDQALIDRFADVTADHQWIHVDVERATKEIGGTIAHGFLTVSLMPRMMESIIRIEGYKRSINYGSNRLRFTGTVPSGARVRLRAKLISVEPKQDGLLLQRDSTIEVEGQERPALVAEWLTLLVL